MEPCTYIVVVKAEVLYIVHVYSCMDVFYGHLIMGICIIHSHLLKVPSNGLVQSIQLEYIHWTVSLIPRLFPGEGKEPGRRTNEKPLHIAITSVALRHKYTDVFRQYPIAVEFHHDYAHAHTVYTRLFPFPRKEPGDEDIEIMINEQSDWSVV